MILYLLELTTSSHICKSKHQWFPLNINQAYSLDSDPAGRILEVTWVKELRFFKAKLFTASQEQDGVVLEGRKEAQMLL